MELYRDQDLTEKLIKYLKNHGYPEECFAIEYSLARDCRVDLAIIDRTLNIPIMLFELKDKKNESTKQMGLKQIRRSLTFLEDKDTPCYLVFPKDIEPFFEAIRVYPSAHDDTQDLNMQVKEDLNFGKFSYNINTRVSKARGNKIEKKRKMVVAFKWVCWAIALLLIIIGYLVAAGMIFITTNALYIFALAIALIICPFVSSIKILGIEIKQLEDQTLLASGENNHGSFCPTLTTQK